jgi:membrane-associated protein
MDYIRWFIDYILHLNQNMGALIQQYGTQIYALMFGIIFLETGVVVFPFLPGDSLLFTAGSFAAIGQLSAWKIFFLLWLAAVLGDNVNYWIGRFIGPRAFKFGKSRWFNPAHLQKTHQFFEKYGPKAIIFARFMPFIRTFTPFVAGIGAMSYARFLPYDILGGFLWVGICVGAGFQFGQVSFVQKHFEMVIVSIIIISMIPGILEFMRQRAESRNKSKHLPVQE